MTPTHDPTTRPLVTSRSQPPGARRIPGRRRPDRPAAPARPLAPGAAVRVRPGTPVAEGHDRCW